MSCEVSENCLNRFDCSFCWNFAEYRPQNAKIKSPKQLAEKSAIKAERKNKRLTDASKRGKANKRNGRAAEKGCEKLLQGWGLQAHRVPMSGALKLIGSVTPGLEDKLSGDLRVTINGTEYTIESKRKQNANSLYKLAEHGLIHIEGFCYMMRQDLMQYIVSGGRLTTDHIMPDKGFGYLHKFFDQDGSDIVTVWRPWHDYLFFITEDAYKKIIGE